ncbi:MAG: uroporphyrinogen-III synthase [Polyangiaceae bacterium]
MGDSLGGATVALLEARMESELGSLVRRHGGEPMCVPALREVERDCSAEASRAIDAMVQGCAVVVLTTGAGLTRWVAVAKGIGRDRDLREGLARATVVCRGPKPVAALKREGIAIALVRAEPPHTTTQLLEALGAIPLQDRDAVVVQDGGAARAVLDAIEARGARVHEVKPYVWALPEDLSALRGLVRAITGARVRAVAFTTQVQAKHLFDVADAMGERASLVEALRGRVVVAAIGPTCARALIELGAPPHVVPERANMGAMVAALARLDWKVSAGR